MYTEHEKELYYLTCGAWIASQYSDWLRAGRSGDRIPVGARLSVQVQTGSEANPVSYTMGTGSFPGVRQPERGVDNPPPSRERVELYIYSPLGLRSLF
jgi:hypothetical protein